MTAQGPEAAEAAEEEEPAEAAEAAEAVADSDEDEEEEEPEDEEEEEPVEEAPAPAAAAAAAASLPGEARFVWIDQPVRIKIARRASEKISTIQGKILSACGTTYKQLVQQADKGWGDEHGAKIKATWSSELIKVAPKNEQEGEDEAKEEEEGGG